MWLFFLSSGFPMLYLEFLPLLYIKMVIEGSLAWYLLCFGKIHWVFHWWEELSKEWICILLSLLLFLLRSPVSGVQPVNMGGWLYRKCLPYLVWLSYLFLASRYWSGQPPVLWWHCQWFVCLGQTLLDFLRWLSATLSLFCLPLFLLLSCRRNCRMKWAWTC